MKKLILLQITVLLTLSTVCAQVPQILALYSHGDHNKEWLESLFLYDDNTFKFVQIRQLSHIFRVFGRWERVDDTLILNSGSMQEAFKVKEMKSDDKKPHALFKISDNDGISAQCDIYVVTPQLDTVVFSSDDRGLAIVNGDISAFWIDTGRVSSSIHKLAPTTNEVHVIFNFERIFDNEEWIFEHEDTLRPRNPRGDLLNHVFIRVCDENIYDL